MLLTQEYEHLGEILVPHIITFVNQFDGYPNELDYYLITVPLSRDVLRLDCLLTVILAAHGLTGVRWGNIDGPGPGAWLAYLLTTGWQRHLKHPHYYVVLSDEKYRVYNWWQHFGTYNLEAMYPTPGLETFFVLFYNTKSIKIDAAMNPTGCRAYCYYCSKELLDTDCASPADCLQRGTNMVEAGLNKGSNVKWLVLREDIKLGPDLNKSGFIAAPCHWPFFARHQEGNECVVMSTQDAALRFSVSALNSSVLAATIGLYKDRKHRLPRIHWSKVDSHYEDVTTRHVVYPLRIFPFFQIANKSQTSLKLITADGVKTKKPAVDLYLTPFDLASWTGTLVLLFVVTGTIIAVLTKQRGYESARRMLRRGLFWIYSALLEQPDSANFSSSRTTALAACQLDSSCLRYSCAAR